MSRSAEYYGRFAEEAGLDLGEIETWELVERAFAATGAEAMSEVDRFDAVVDYLMATRYFREAVAVARQEVTPLESEAGLDAAGLWELVSERAHALCAPVDTARLARMLRVSLRRAQTVMRSLDGYMVGTQRVVPLFKAREYAARDRKPGRPRK